MKAKQIEKLLKGVYKHFIDSIDDEGIKTIISNKTFITGGCIPSMLLDEFVNDFDFYFFSKDDAEEVRKYFTAQEKNKSNKEQKYKVSLITDNAINLTDKVQLITKFTGSPKQVTNNFDWQHIKSYYIYNKGLTLTEDVYKLIVEKELIYTGSNYPLSSLLRLRKYLKKGWYVSTKTMVHIILEVVSAFQDQSISINNEEQIELMEEFNYEHNSYKVNVETLVKQLNGVDPLTIQKRLEAVLGKRLLIEEIIELF